MVGDHALKPLLSEKYSEWEPRVSSDGQWMAYVSNELGREEVYVRPFPEVNKGRWTVSTNGGTSPLWSRNGQELFYWTDDALMVVPVQTVPTFIHKTPKVQFKRAPVWTGLFGVTRIPWDISPDGKRFLMMKDVRPTGTAEAPRKINIVLNWFEELKQRVPVK